MPQIVLAVAAAAAGAAAGAAVGGGIVGAIVGTVVAVGVSYAGAAILGLNRPPGVPDTRRDRRQPIRNATAARQVVYGRARVSGPLVYASSSGPDRRFLHVVIPVAGHPVAGMDAVWIGDERIAVEDISAGGWVLTDKYRRTRLVDPGGPQDDNFALVEETRSLLRVRFYDGTQTAADPDLVAESEDGWSPQHVLRGTAYLYVRMEYDEDAFRSGFQGAGVELRGKNDILDPRTNVRAYSFNAALVVLDYLRSADGLACADDELDIPSFITAANICDELVQITGDGAVGWRYRADGSFDLDSTPLDVVEDMLAACGGTLVYVEGRYRLHVAAYVAPTDTLGVSDIAGAVDLQTRPPRRELFNAVRGTFLAPDRGYQQSEFPPVTDAGFAAEDGETIHRDIELPFVSDIHQAQRLARLALLRARESLTLRVPVKYAGIRYVVWQMLSVTLPDFGFAAKPFRITDLAFDPATGLLTLTLREESAASYAWTWNQAAAPALAPNTALVDPFAIPPPPGFSVTEDLYVTAGGGGVKTRAVLRWQPPPHPFVTGYEWRARPAAAAAWAVSGTAQNDRLASIDDLADGLWVFQVRARSLVASGAWAELQANIGALAAQPPADITGLEVQTIGGFAFLRWARHPDLDVRIGGRIEFRHTPDTVSPSWVGSTGIGQAQPGDSTFAVLPLKPGAYLAKAVDQGGRYSVAEAVIRTTQATAIGFANVTTLTEHPTFSGAKTSTIVASSKLRLDTGGNIDGVAGFDAIADLDASGGVLASGSYTFSGGMDLTTVRSVRLTGRMLAAVVNTLDQVDARAATVDDWLSFDGTAGGEADAWIEVRETNDNPGGTPTWSAWRRLDAAEFRARAFQYRAHLRSYDAAFNIEVSELSVTADEVV